MTRHPAGRLLGNIIKDDIEALSPDRLRQWLADEIREAFDARRVQFRMVEIDREREIPNENAPVFGADAPAPPNLTITERAADLRIEGRPAVLGDLREIVVDEFAAPGQNNENPPDERVVLFRFRFPRTICWVALHGARAIDANADVDLLGEILGAAIRIATTPLLAINPDTAHGLRHAFASGLHSYSLHDSAEDFEFICKSWKDATKADGVWLWLYNSISDCYELAGIAGVALDQPHLAHFANKTPSPGKSGLGHYVSITRKPALVDKIPGWTRTHEGLDYHLALEDLLVQLGIRSLVCIPLLQPSRHGAQATASSNCSVISLLYKQTAPRIHHSDDHLLSMGRQTAAIVGTSRMIHERAILLELNALAQRHLTGSAIRPRPARDEYLNALIELIKTHLNVNGASIFYRMPFEPGVYCIASTGIEDPKNPGKQLAAEALVSVEYKAAEGWTGVCFGELRTLVGFDRDEKNGGHKAKFRELETIPSKPDFDPYLFVPIPPPVDESLSQRRALGVIRCVEHTSRLYRNSLCYFDANEVRILEFIAQQVGPVLQTFAQRIEREATITTVTHDLYAPLGMIRNTIDRIVKNFEGKLPQREYDLYNIQASALNAVNLALQLDPDPERSIEISPRPTHLEGDIIARLRAMLSHYAETLSKMRIEFASFQEIPQLKLDPNVVERAFFNVIINAIKYGDRNTIINIQPRPLGSSGAYFIIDVVNHGPGIDPAEEAYIFKPYYRSKRAIKSRRPGSGLGLTIALRCMRLHGGDLRLTSRQNPTIFSFYFPKTLQI
ncbi:MAG: HAMP domain-containing histidine kinase [Planctomycetes bacterium]|nr:HAMP domain-containing histidine kinase [Planctomycetota bacterium]